MVLERVNQMKSVSVYISLSIGPIRLERLIESG